MRLTRKQRRGEMKKKRRRKRKMMKKMRMAWMRKKKIRGVMTLDSGRLWFATRPHRMVIHTRAFHVLFCFVFCVVSSYKYNN